MISGRKSNYTCFLLSLTKLQKCIHGTTKFESAYTLKILLGDRIEYSDKRRLWLIADIMPQVFSAALYCCASILNAKEHGKETQDEDSNS